MGGIAEFVGKKGEGGERYRKGEDKPMVRGKPLEDAGFGGSSMLKQLYEP